MENITDIIDCLVQDLRGLIRDMSVPLQGGPCVDTLMRVRTIPDRMRDLIPRADAVERGVLAFYALTVTEMLQSLGSDQQWHHELAWFMRDLVKIAHRLLQTHDNKCGIKRAERQKTQAENDNRRAQFLLTQSTHRAAVRYA